MTHRTLTLQATDLGAMIGHAERERPNEACGLLGGPPGQVRRVYLVENIRHSPVEYELNPAEQVRAMLEIEAEGWDVCGIFHSHPGGPPVPSATDVAQAYYPDAVYIILAPGPGGEWLARGFTIVDGQVAEVRLEIAV